MLQSSSSTRGSSKSKKSQQEDKRIRRLYQSLLQRRPINYWNILDFPYLAEVVRHDSSYLRRILTNIFIDHPALSQYLILIAWRELWRKTKHSKSQAEQQKASRYEMLPIGFERTLWLMYKRQIELSSIWSPMVVLEISKVAKEMLPTLTFNQFLSKINGLRDCSFKVPEPYLVPRISPSKDQEGLVRLVVMIVFGLHFIWIEDCPLYITS